MSNESPTSSSAKMLNKNNNYRGHSLTDILLTCQEFFGTNFQQIQGKNLRFNEIQFKECTFDVATVRDSVWKNCLLSQCSGKFVDFENTELIESTLEKSSFLQSSFYECSFENSSISQVNFQDSDLRNCNFTGATLDSVNLRNCDLAGADFTDVTLINCIVQGARISNVKGLSPQLKDQLLANGAYQGFTPAINKLKTRGQLLGKQLQGLREKTKELPLPSFHPQRFVKWSQETFEEWQASQKRQRELREQEEQLWKEEQEKRRQTKSQQRKEREQRRKEEQARLQDEKKQLQKRKQLREKRIRQLQKQESQQKKRVQSLQEFFSQNPNSQLPQEILNAAGEAFQAFENADDASKEESQLRELVYQNPEDETLFNQLTEAITQSQVLAEKALQKQDTYQKLLGDWQEEQDKIREQFLRAQLSQSEQQLKSFQAHIQDQSKKEQEKQREKKEQFQKISEDLQKQADSVLSEKQKKLQKEKIQQAEKKAAEIAAELQKKQEEEELLRLKEIEKREKELRLQKELEKRAEFQEEKEQKQKEREEKRAQEEKRRAEEIALKKQREEERKRLLAQIKQAQNDVLHQEEQLRKIQKAEKKATQIARKIKEQQFFEQRALEQEKEQDKKKEYIEKQLERERRFQEEEEKQKKLRAQIQKAEEELKKKEQYLLKIQKAEKKAAEIARKLKEQEEKEQEKIRLKEREKEQEKLQKQRWLDEQRSRIESIARRQEKQQPTKPEKDDVSIHLDFLQKAIQEQEQYLLEIQQKENAIAETLQKLQEEKSKQLTVDDAFLQKNLHEQEQYLLQIQKIEKELLEKQEQLSQLKIAAKKQEEQALSKQAQAQSRTEIEARKKARLEEKERKQQEKEQQERQRLEQAIQRKEDEEARRQEEIQRKKDEETRRWQLQQKIILAEQEHRQREEKLLQIHRADNTAKEIADSIRKEQEEQKKAEKKKLRQEERQQKRLELEKQRQLLEQEKKLKRLELEKQQEEEQQKRAVLQQEARLKLLKRQLLDEAYRQESEEIEEQLAQEYQERTQKEELLEKKKQQLLEQLKEEEERLKNDPLLQEAKFQELLFERQKNRLNRLEKKEQDIKDKLRSLEQEEALDRLESAKTPDKGFSEIIEQVQINPQSPWQQYWYRFTDVVARQSPSFANQLDQAKEFLEEEVIARRALAVRAREQQKQIAKEALEEKRQQEQQQRIARLEFIRAKEEEREKRRQQEELFRAKQRTAQERKRQLLDMPPAERHELRRGEFISQEFPIMEHAEKDLRSSNLVALDWHRANLQHALLSASRMEGIGLIEANCAHAYLDFARLNGATMDGCHLEKANLEGAILKEASLVGAWLRLARLYDCDLQQADFTGAHLPKVDFTGSVAQNASFAGADISGAIFSEVRLEGASFRGAELSGAIFERAHLAEVDFHQANVKDTDFRGVFGLSKEDLLQLQSRGALVHLEDAQDHSTGPVSQIRAAIVLFGLGLGSFLFSSYLSSNPSELGSLEKEAEELRLEDPLLASDKYEALAAQTQTLEDQVNYLIEAAVLAEQANDIERADKVFQKALVAADFHTELHTKLNLRMAQFYLEHSQPQKAKQSLDSLLSTQTLSSFQHARLIIYNEMIAEILGLDLGAQLEPIYQQLEGLPEVEADLRMALSDLRMQRQQPQKALEELQLASQLPISEELQVRLLEATARVHDRIGNLSEAVSAYENLLEKTDPGSITAKAARLALADLKRREKQPEEALKYLEEIIATEGDARLLSRALFIQGRIYEEQEQITLATERYQEVLNIETAEPETKEEARISLARLVLQGKTENTDSLSPEILAQASLGKMRSLLDKNAPEQVIEMVNELLAQEALNDDITRAAKNIRAEALSAMGKYQEANDEWEELLRESKISSLEKQHIENLLAYNRLQNNDIEGARTAFLSLRNSSDLSTRSQGLLGLAETYRLTGELEKAKELYHSILEQNQDREIILQTWQELSEIASEQDRPEDRLQAWQNILLNAGEDESLQAEAHRSISSALVELGRIEEAITQCELGMNTPAAELQCASVLEMIGDPQSLPRYQKLFADENLPSALRAEASLGAARQLQGEEQFQLLKEALGLSQMEPVIELQLLYFMENHRSLLSEEELSKLEEREKILSELAPDLLVQHLLEQMSLYRSQGMIEKAIEQMSRGISNLPEEKSLPLQLELADMYLENQNWSKAEDTYSKLISKSSELRYPAQFGLALSFKSQERYPEMIALIKEIEPQSSEELQGIQQLLESIPEEAQSEEIQQLWQELAQKSDDADLQFSALLQEADQLLQNDKFDEALSKYEEAEKIALEDQQIGWAKLGKARTLSTAEKDPSSILLELSDHSNREVGMQALIQLAQFYLEQDKPQKALQALEGKSASDLGPGWDSSLEEIRIYALSALDNYTEASQSISQLAARWPDEEQVQIPAKILSIHLLKQQEQYDDAQNLLQKTLQETTEEGYREMLETLGEELAKY